MSKSLAEVLSEIDDPEAVDFILNEVRGHDTSSAEATDEIVSTTLQQQYDRFLRRRQNRSPTTIAQYKRTIPDLIDYAENNKVRSPYQLSTDLIDGYVDLLMERYDADATILTYTKNAGVFLRWLNARNKCSEAVYEVLSKDALGLSPKARDEAIPEPVARHIIEQLHQHRRGSHLHAAMELFWNGGPRIGDVYSADLRDFLPEENTLKFRHRPEEGTRLKNGSADDDTVGDGERDIILKDRVVDALQLYINTERPDVKDDFGREPLFATKYGRAARSTLRRWIYEATSCRWAPRMQDTPDCNGNCDPDSSVCPCSYYPHAIRRGAIVHHLSGDLRQDRASQRFDVSIPILKKHYDPRTKSRQLADRADAVRDAWADW